MLSTPSQLQIQSTALYGRLWAVLTTSQPVLMAYAYLSIHVWFGRVTPLKDNLKYWRNNKYVEGELRKHEAPENIMLIQ